MPPILEDTELLRAPGVQHGLLMIALRVLSSSLLTWVTVLGGGAMWAFVVVAPTTPKILSAVGYCVTILVPILWRETKEQRP